ncbi:hypothetical protein [Brevundimonas sp.]|uniref:hypothetical protein n=1 Tax=Brevundimonas sp. TaxID=1871086 RepID=UPI002FC7A4FC
MSAIAPDRPFFPPNPTGQGGASAFNATRALKDAQAAFFRPVAASVTPAVAQPTKSETVDLPALDTQPAFKRPGSYLDIRV